MRVVKEVPHTQFKITIFSWNEKYIIKIEIGQFEQVYKINHMDVAGLDDVVDRIDKEFLEETMQRFISMRSSFSDALKRKNLVK
jgi:hypothetical protein